MLGRRPKSHRSDGLRSRAAILTAAVEVASTGGLEALSIGALAERTGLSKSGLFAHFGSKQELQLATLRAARRAVEREVVQPAGVAPPGVARLIALTEAYLTSIRRPAHPAGCLHAAPVTVEVLPPPVRAEVARMERRMFAHLLRQVRAARRSGELAAATDPVQLAYEIHALLAAADAWTRMGGGADGTARARRGIETLILAAARRDPQVEWRGP